MSRQSARAVSERAWRTKRDLSKSFSEETSRAREPVRDLGAKTQIYVGGMAEWSMAVVLKTTVRETVPGVRIPLPPPTYTRATVGVVSGFRRRAALAALGTNPSPSANLC